MGISLQSKIILLLQSFFILILFTSCVLGKKKHNRHNRNDNHIDTDFPDKYPDEYSDIRDLNGSLISHPIYVNQSGRFFGKLISGIKNAAIDLAQLKPIEAMNSLYNGLSSAAIDAMKKFGEFEGIVQTALTNFVSDEVNEIMDEILTRPIKYHIFTQQNKKESYLMNSTEGIEVGPNWNRDGLTIVIIHGFSVDYFVTTPKENYKGQLRIKNKYLKAGSKDNLIVADWTSYTRTLNYFAAAAATRLAGANVAELLVNLKKNGHIKSFDDIHIVGFSLGGHVSGIAGRIVQDLTNGEMVGRITGLDPAGLLFDQPDGKVPLDHKNFLDKSDAKFVDVIHCNAHKGVITIAATQLGTNAIAGHADFYPNGGTLQPDCDVYGESIQKLSCSHSRCWQLYAESVGDTKYPACRCKSWEEFEANNCTCDNKVYFGHLCDSKASGLYFLKAQINDGYEDNEELYFDKKPSDFMALIDEKDKKKVLAMGRR